MEGYAYLVAAIVLGVAVLTAIYLYQRRRSQAGHSWLSYVLIWPLVLDAAKSKRDGRFLTKREWLGWGIVVLLVVLAIVLVPSNRGGS